MIKEKNHARLTSGPVGRTLINLTIPMFFGMIGMVAFNLVDTFYVGKLGTLELAALSFTFPVVLVINSIALGLGMGASALISRAIGEGDQYKVRRYTTDSLTLALLVVFCFIIIGQLTLDFLFRTLGADTEILEFIKQYMRIWYFGMIFVVVPMVGNNAIRATGDTKTPSAIMMVAVVMNFILDPILIFGLGPIPALGLRGAAISTVSSRFVTFTVALWVLARREHMISFKRISLKLLIANWKAILFLGVPIGFSRMIIPLSTGVITSLIAGFGPQAVAGFGVATRVEFFALSVIRALSSIIGPFVGQNFGAKRYARVRQGVKYSQKFSLFWGFLMLVILGIFSRQIAMIFNSDPVVVATVRNYLTLVPIGYGLMGISLIINITLNVLKKPYQAAGLTLVQMLGLYVPFAYLGASLAGIRGIFAGITLAYCFTGVLAYLILKYYLAKMLPKQA